MSLNKAQAKQYAKACELLEKNSLAFEERCFVIDHFHEGGDSSNKYGSAHFTPTIWPMISSSMWWGRVCLICAPVSAFCLSSPILRLGLDTRVANPKILALLNPRLRWRNSRCSCSDGQGILQGPRGMVDASILRFD